jgi:hypothetical protein
MLRKVHALHQLLSTVSCIVKIMIFSEETLIPLYHLSTWSPFLSIIHINVTSKADQGMQLVVMQKCLDN